MNKVPLITLELSGFHCFKDFVTVTSVTFCHFGDLFSSYFSLLHWAPVTLIFFQVFVFFFLTCQWPFLMQGLCICHSLCLKHSSSLELIGWLASHLSGRSFKYHILPKPRGSINIIYCPNLVAIINTHLLFFDIYRSFFQEWLNWMTLLRVSSEVAVKCWSEL